MLKGLREAVERLYGDWYLVHLGLRWDEFLEHDTRCERGGLLEPMSSVGDIQTVPGELLAKFQTSFYADPIDALFKALGVE